MPHDTGALPNLITILLLTVHAVLDWRVRVQPHYRLRERGWGEGQENTALSSWQSRTPLALAARTRCQKPRRRPRPTTIRNRPPAGGDPLRSRCTLAYPEHVWLLPTPLEIPRGCSL